ncbi:MAG: aminotransferase class I/II-fold pyridoxal phosphate-dependent enzyme [Candidatus Marinimicrobia bacterium]|nr:aminotransferase class I/II-fold pyridoxal phosphate-dependent enzyme [Candidatus Neomarinimicrobiota bacterium]MBT3937786.1 aminotransferase class I/II-fold pyridoxal phosphate-dependent enzyme [Candidatus Neomarinimicrobiota bacterium]MBT3960415.1 aminotransferase class I/II-fold pyridoxal phosphate-dependent enzyme [Candidatus Neomarinimicrobiota bacterium]MBT4635228.1 aminotransferase class I/II-fold pyridoxal phosphate-dependent enzyme [Candidatus Neomarinimicrobiota bacterium]MBT468430
MKLANQLEQLGTETAFSVSLLAKLWAEKGNHVYPFHLGDMNLPTPENIIEATIKAIRDGYTGYAPAQGILPLRQALADNVGSSRGVTYTPENIAIQPGGKPTVWKFIAVIMNPGDEVLYPNPGYPIYESQIEYQGGIAVPYGYTETSSGFAIDLEKLKASITPKTKAIIYNNYQNPISASSTKEEMEAIAALAIKHDLWVMADDAYFEIRYSDSDPLSIVSIPGMKERTVILYTFSKKYAMTGWRLGATIGPKPFIEMVAKLNVNDESCSNHFIQHAMVEGVTGDQSGFQAILHELKCRRDAAVGALNTIDGISIPTPESTFYLFPNVTEIMNRKGFANIGQLQEGSLENTGVSFCTRNHFGRPVDGEKDFFIRFAYSGISVEDIQEGLALLKNYFEQS